jgi:hypothetical protein
MFSDTLLGECEMPIEHFENYNFFNQQLDLTFKNTKVASINLVVQTREPSNKFINSIFNEIHNLIFRESLQLTLGIP